MRIATTLLATTGAAAVLLSGAALSAGCGEEEAPQPAETTTAQPDDAGDASDEAPPATDAGDERPAGREATAQTSRRGRAERAAVATARDYVEALDAGDGARLCALFAPGAIGALKLPRERGGCAGSLEASLGYRDPRGFPVWESSSVEGIVSVDVGGDDAKVVATMLTRFADRDNPSFEDDPIYLRRIGDEWVIAQPSLTLYRAVGIAEPPPAALAPPKDPLG